MTTRAKTKATRVSKRDLFNELSEGMTALAEARGGKRTLRTHVAQFKPAPEVSPAQLLRTAESSSVARGRSRTFARYRRTSSQAGLKSLLALEDRPHIRRRSNPRSVNTQALRLDSRRRLSPTR